MQEHKIRVEADHAAAIDILLLLADVRADALEYDRALGLLAHAEDAVGLLPVEYELKRRAWATR